MVKEAGTLRTEAEEARFVEGRAAGVGGSDWGDVLNIEPYGCRRRCWYQKRGIAEDYPADKAGVFERGHVLEPIVATKYEQASGRNTMRVGRLPDMRLPDWWIGNPDYGIIDNNDGRGPGVLECKTSNPWVFAKVAQNGPPDYHIAQAHHYLALTGRKWGVIAYLCSDTFEFISFEIEFDEALFDRMLDAGVKFWREVEHGPAPDQLDSKDKRCGRCEWRSTCQGEALTVFDSEPMDVERLEGDEADAIVAAVEYYNEVKTIADEAAGALDEAKDALTLALGSFRKVAVPGARVYWTETKPRVTFDRKAFVSDHPDLAPKYLKTGRASSRLNVYPV